MTPAPYRPHFDAYARFFAAVLSAAALQAQGRPADALAALGPATAVERSIPTPTSYPFAYARFLRATLLEQTGQLEEALNWFATFPEPDGGDVPFRAAAYLAQSGIHTRLGKADVAAGEYAVARALLRDAEPEATRELAGTNGKRP